MLLVCFSVTPLLHPALLLVLQFPEDAVQRTEEGGDNQIKNSTNPINADVLFMWAGCIRDDCAARNVELNLCWSFVVPACIPVRIDSCSIHRDCLCFVLFFSSP